MTAHHWSRGDLSAGFVTVVGVATGVALVYRLLPGVGVAWPALPANLFEVGFLALPTAGLSFTGYWLHASELPGATAWRVGQSAVAGVFAAVVVAVAVLSAVPLAEVPLAGVFLLLVGCGGEGALLGVLVGVTGAFAGSRTGDVDRLVFLHRLLRHNIRNHVNVIEGNAAVIDADADRVGTITARTGAIVDLLEDTGLAVEATVSSPDPVPIDLSAMLDDAVAVVADAYPRATIETDYPEGVRVLADDTVGAAFENLIDNAVEHNDREAPTVAVTVEETADTVRVRIADDGPGIDDPESVLEPSLGAVHGLGLYLAEGLIEGCGGRFRIERNEPRGTVAVATLPAHPTGSNR